MCVRPLTGRSTVGRTLVRMLLDSAPGMLTERELELLGDQDGPLEARPVFEQVLQGDREIASAFVLHCEAHHPAAYIDCFAARRTDTPEGFNQAIVALEQRITAGRAHREFDRFLDSLPEKLALRATSAIKRALGTEAIPAEKRPGLPPFDPTTLRRIHRAAERLYRECSRRREPEESSLRVMKAGFQELGAAPVVAAIDELLSARPIPQKDVFAMVYDVRTHLPHPDPVLRDFQRWLESPPGTQRETVDLVENHWLPRLLRLDREGRMIAAEVFKAKIHSPKVADRRDALVARLSA